MHHRLTSFHRIWRHPLLGGLLVALLGGSLSCGAERRAGEGDVAAAALPLVITETSKLESGSFGGSPFGHDAFGASMAGSGETLVVGAPSYEVSSAQPDMGAASIVVQSGDAWKLQQQYAHPLNQFHAHYGTSVAIASDTAVVGAPRHDPLGGADDEGAAYVYVRSGDAWTDQAELEASDGKMGDEFGASVAVSGDTALVAAIDADSANVLDAGAVYVFVRSSGAWMEQAKLLASGATAPEKFGYAVALSGDTALVGAPTSTDPFGNSKGAVYVFVRSGDAWTEQAKLVPSDGASYQWFGSAVALSGDTAFVGAWGGTGATTEDAGVVHVFARSGGVWTETAKIAASDEAYGAKFGRSVAIAGDRLLVGAPGDETNGSSAGAAYAFARVGDAWTEQAKLLASDGYQDQTFGISVAFAGNAAFVGAHHSSTDDGGVYRFALPSVDGAACTLAEQCQSGFCVDGVCCNSACGGGDGDDCQACSVNAGAAVDGACAPVAAATVCRAAAGDCDVAEVCDGSAVSCPANATSPDGTACAGGTCSAGVCETSGGVGGAGGTGDEGGGDAGGGVTDGGGCGCRVAGDGDRTAMPVVLGALALGLLAAGRRRPRARKIFSSDR